MTILISSILAGTVGIIAALSGTIIWVTRRAFSSDDAALEASGVLLELQTRITEYEHAEQEWRDLTATLRSERDREVSARQLAEEMLDDVISHLDNRCPPAVIADGISRDLARLRTMSEAAVDSDDSDSSRKMHGTITVEDRGDGEGGVAGSE